MPLIKIIRKPVTSAVRKVPTATCATVMPMTLERVGREVASENEDPTKVESLADGFEKFKPSLNFVGRAGEGETEFRADLQFRSIKDFEPENIQKRQEVKGPDGEVSYLRNDLADLKTNIDLLYRLKKRWALPAVRRAWANPEQRQEIIGALSRLRTELEKVAEKGGKA